IMSRFRLRFGRYRQQELVALRGDVVDLDVDLLLRRPFLDQRLGCAVGARHPMVPKTDRELAGGMRTADMRHGDQGRGGRSRGEKTPSGELALAHAEFPLWIEAAISHSATVRSKASIRRPYWSIMSAVAPRT